MVKTILSGNIILNEKGEIYLLFRKKHKHYETPGGKAETKKPSKQDLLKTAKKELSEEVKGIKKIKTMDYYSRINFTIPDGRKATAHKFITIIEGNPQPNETIFDKKKSKWIKLEELGKFKLSPDFLIIRKKLLENKDKLMKKYFPKQAILVHGWSGSPGKDWFPWMKNRLEKKGFQVLVPEMPETDTPKIKPWISELNKLKIKEDALIIGHSIGCQTILRYLEKRKVGKAILVAPWLRLKEASYEDENSRKLISPWLNKKINWKKAKNNAKEFICIFSDNDPFVFVEESKKFKKFLHAKIIIKKNRGHFSSEEGINEVPEVLKEI